MMLGNLRSTLRNMDASIRESAEKCPQCGLPKAGLVFTKPGTMHGKGTGQHGASHYSGVSQTREEAGLCTCPDKEAA
jgi:hypothetical protein